MYKILIFSILLFFGLSISTPVDAQTLIEYQKQLQQQKRKEATAKPKNSSQRTNNKTATPKKPVQAQAKTGSGDAEKRKYDEACQKGTKVALQEYAKRYPNGKYISDVKERIDSIDETSLWKSAKEENTIDGYNRYLQQSKLRTYETEARNAIEEIQAGIAWNYVKTSDNPETVMSFIKTHLNSSYKEQATRRYYELWGVRHYNQGNLTNAKACFDLAGGKYSLEYRNRFLYDKCVEQEDIEYREYKNLTYNYQYKNFLVKYPNSKYYNNVANELARRNGEHYKALNTTQRQRERNVRENVKRTETIVRKNRVRSNGGYVQVGLEILDYGMYFKIQDNRDSWMPTTDRRVALYYNLGVNLKIGNYKSPVQFAIGAKPGISVFHYCYENGSIDISETSHSFHIPLFAKLKVNICTAGYSKFYISGLGLYNFKNKDFEAGGGLGFAWRHWDWLTLYYKHSVPKGTRFFGTSLTYYFCR